MAPSIKGFLVLVLTLLSSVLVAQQRGNPFIRNFEPSEYGAHNQVWDITQNSLGHMVIGTGTGMLIYDGIDFRKVGGSAQMTTKLRATSDGSIYFSANNIIGQIVGIETDDPTHFSLVSKIDSSAHGFFFASEIISTDRDVWITASNKVFRYNGETFDIYDNNDSELFKVFHINGDIFVGDRENGLLRFAENELVPAIGGNALSGEMLPYFMVTLDEHRVLIGTLRNGLYEYNTRSGSVTLFQNEVNDQLKSAGILVGIELSNGQIAIGTSNSGVFIIDIDGRLKMQIDRESGLNPEGVNGLFEDRQGNLWIAMNYGFALAEISTPISHFGEKSGLNGTVTYAIEFDNTVYASTSMGLFKKEGRNFKPIDEITSITWDLAIYQDPDRSEHPQLLVSNAFGLYLMYGDNVSRISSTYSASVLQSKVNPSRIYSGSTTGLDYFEKIGGQFRKSTIEFNFSNPVRQIMEDKNGGLWIATQSNGVRYINSNLELDNIRVYMNENEYDVRTNATLHWIENQLFVSTSDNFYQYDALEDTFRDWTPPDLDSQELKGVYRFYHRNGTLWTGASNTRTGIVEYANVFTDSVTVSKGQFSAIPYTVSLVINEIRGDIWFGNAFGLYKYDSDNRKSGYVFEDVQLRRVEVIRDTTLIYNPLVSSTFREPFANSRYRFVVSAPWYDSGGVMEFRYKLENNDDQWSDWSRNNVVEYTSLREGEYSILFQARNRNGDLSTVNQYTFHITPPWYRTFFAYLVISFLFLGFIFYSTKKYLHQKTRRLEEFNAKLEQQVIERSEEIKRQNEILRQLNSEKDDFMNIAVHDLRNPLTGVQGIATMLMDAEKSPPLDTLRDYGNIIHSSSVRMFELIDNYLNSHRIEQGEVIAVIVPHSLEQLILESVERFGRTLEKKNMTVNLNLASIETRINADSRLTSQILDNIISNAIKYSPAESVITIESGIDSTKGYFSVRDQGVGIPKEKQSDLFQKFSKIGTKPTGGEVSVGLGLSIVKKLLDMMEGEIFCMSEAGSGATFIVKLPLADEV